MTNSIFAEKETLAPSNFTSFVENFILSWGANTDNPISVQSPTVGRLMRGYVYLIRVDSHLSKVLGCHHQWKSPGIYATFKWIAVIQTEMGLVGVENKGFLVEG